MSKWLEERAAEAGMSSTAELASQILHEMLHAVPLLDCKYEELAPGVYLLTSALLEEYCCSCSSESESEAERRAEREATLQARVKAMLDAGLEHFVQKKHGGTAENHADEKEVEYCATVSASGGTASTAVHSMAGAAGATTEGCTGCEIGIRPDLDTAKAWLEERAAEAGMSSTAELASQILHEMLHAVPLLDCKYEELAPGVYLLTSALLEEYCSSEAERLAEREATLQARVKVMLDAGLDHFVQKKHGGTAENQADATEDVFFSATIGSREI